MASAVMRDRYAIARHAAWAQWGRRHHGLIVGLDVARWLAGPVAVLVLFGSVGYGLYWMWGHLSPGRLALWSALAAVALLLGFLGRELATGAGVRRRAAGVASLSGASIAVLASVVLLFGASITALVR
jgi:hypothetical protein